VRMRCTFLSFLMFLFLHLKYNLMLARWCTLSQTFPMLKKREVLSPLKRCLALSEPTGFFFWYFKELPLSPQHILHTTIELSALNISHYTWTLQQRKWTEQWPFIREPWFSQYKPRTTLTHKEHFLHDYYRASVPGEHFQCSCVITLD